MPGPPPPPPMAPAAPPPPTFSMPKGAPDDHGALLKSIRQGTKLKKTVTVDKSGPAIPGKVSSASAQNISSSNSGTTSNNSTTAQIPNGLPLGGLFAGGMPKLRATGMLGSSTLNNGSTNNMRNISNSSNQSKPVTPVKNFNSIQNELKKQLASPGDNRNRGPPPPAPVRNFSNSADDSSTPTRPQNLNTNGLLIHASHTSLHHSSSIPASNLQANTSTLHRKAKSNANLSMLDTMDSGFSSLSLLSSTNHTNSASVSNINSHNSNSKPVINHGKPNLAPKPPALNGKPAPPKKLIINGISRAQSMRSPRSPQPLQSPSENSNKFGSVRNMTSMMGQTLASQQQSPRPRPSIANRPSVPPPSIPPQPQSGPPKYISSTAPMKPPSHAPPPPPSLSAATSTNSVNLPQPPSHAPPPPPPPPPHKTQPMRAPPAIPNSSQSNVASTNGSSFVPPPPPPRHSSMRPEQQTPRILAISNSSSTRSLAVDFDEKFRDFFESVDKFPRPPPYRNVLKMYTNKQALSKQQAPLPPQTSSHNLHTANRMGWDPTTAC